jgi:YbbR domain-containing protein
MSAKGGLRDQIQAAFVENLGLKILSLCCAVALYAFTHGPETAQRTFSVSVVSIMPLDSAKRQLVTQPPTEVAVTLRGSRAQIDELHSDDIGALRLDLHSGQDETIDIDDKMLHVPAGLSVLQVLPPSIKVTFEDLIAKSVPVQVPRTGEPPPGYAVKGVIASNPAEVQVRGPRSLVDVIQIARTAPFDVTGLGQGVHSLKLPLDKPPNLVAYGVEQVTASVDIARLLVTKSFPRLKVEVIGLPRATTRPSTVTVAVTGTAEDVNAIAPDAIVPRVEPRAAGDDLGKPGNDNLPVLIDVPKGVAVQVDPPKVVVTW